MVVVIVVVVRGGRERTNDTDIHTKPQTLPIPTTRRLALDRCFPQVVLQTNSWRGTHHIIIFGFFVVATSLIMILDGSVEALAGACVCV